MAREALAEEASLWLALKGSPGASHMVPQRRQARHKGLRARCRVRAQRTLQGAGNRVMELLKNVIKDSNHVAYDLLPPRKMHGYNLRTRPCQYVLTSKTFTQTRIFWTEFCMLIFIDYLCMFSYIPSVYVHMAAFVKYIFLNKLLP